MQPSNQPVTFTHARRIAGYNWPLYAAAAVGIVIGAVVALLPATPSVLRWISVHELTRIVSPTGRVVLVEHLRDLAAALAFGPGLFHFRPRGEWMRLATLTGLTLERERPITPFVRVLVFRRLARQQPRNRAPDRARGPNASAPPR